MFLEQLERTLETRHRRVEHRLTDELQLTQELQGIADVLGRRLHAAGPRRAAPPLQGAAPLRADPAVHQPAAFEGLPGDGPAPRRGAPVDAVSAIGKQTGGRHDPANLAGKRERGE